MYAGAGVLRDDLEWRSWGNLSGYSDRTDVPGRMFLLNSMEMWRYHGMGKERSIQGKYLACGSARSFWD
jgi:hypothetical protein